MLRHLWRKLLMVAALAAVCFVLSSSSARACHGHRYGYGGWQGYGCSYGCSYGWGYGSGYGWGYGCYPGYAYTTSYCSPCGTGCGWGWNSCWGSGWSAWSSPCYSSWCNRGYSCYGAASGCCGAAAVTRPTVAGQPTPFARTTASVLAKASKPTGSYLPSTDGVLLSIDVPADALVYVNGMLTKTPGTHRQYICSGLLPGKSYAYQVRAVVSRNGKELSDTKVVRFRAGESHDLAFDLGDRPAAVVAARLR